MTKKEAEKRIQNLRKEISRLRKAYHIQDDPLVVDSIFDSLNKELNALLNKFPEFIDLNAPENRIGGKPLDKFEKFQHEIKMFSIGNVFSNEELFAWNKRNEKLVNESFDFFCELKLDGLAISLIYENGKLVYGLTRGDGEIGENITENLKMINTVPLFLKKPYPEKIEVRGEAIMRKNILAKLNAKNEKEGKTLFANSRNAAAGSLRQLDPKLTQERHLDFFAYEIAQLKGEKWEKYLTEHSEKHLLLEKLGFQVENSSEKINTIEKVPAFIEKINKIRNTLAFNIDGVVININDTKIFNRLGIVGKDPRGIIAYKYPAERVTTLVENIKINVGRTGVLTPLAIFKPTSVAGSTVSKATLHNFDQIERLGIQIGDTVVIEKAGDVIPKVIEVLPNLRTGKEKKFKIPKQCPVCGGKIDKKNLGGTESSFSKGPRFSFAPKGLGQTISQKTFYSPQKNISVAYYCINKNCPARNQRFLEHFISVFEIYELGPKILRRFKEEGLISDPADIFSLKENDIASLERFGEKSAQNIIGEINSKKKISLAKFLWSLGILHVGEGAARELAQHFNTLEKLSQASIEEISAIENIGPAVSKSVYDYFRNKNNLYFIEKLKEQGIEITKTEKNKIGKLNKEIFVLTGTLEAMSRALAKEKILKLGGKISSSVSKNTNYLIAGKDSGSKLFEAQKLGIQILNEEQFLNLIK
jgi:DNA ligase (NAD+)